MMHTYLVGGAVRDRLLNYPVKEQDWVVVGSTPDKMKALGFQQVGRDFPVFLHPKTQEEYALARTERKQGQGYYGFVCDFNANVSLEEDLMRRDLTINAIAMDEKGNLIDPYHGQRDLKKKVLRHVSSAFAEDPVRVLRVARFAARYHHLGFRVARETRALMYRMVTSGELAHLVAERVWQEWQRSLTERNPETFISVLRSCGALQVVFPEMDALYGVPYLKELDREVDSGISALLTLQRATKLSGDPVIRFAAYLYNLDNAQIKSAHWPIHPSGQKGVMVRSLMKRLHIPRTYFQLAERVARFNDKINAISTLSAADIVMILEQTDAFRRAALFDTLLVACEAIVNQLSYNQAAQWRRLKTACDDVSVQAVIRDGYKGQAIQQQVHARRVACIESILKKQEKNNEK